MLGSCVSFMRHNAFSQTLLAPCDDELLEKIPSRSVVTQEAMCNALLTALASHRQVTLESFVFNHPGGAIGANRVSE